MGGRNRRPSPNTHRSSRIKVEVAYALPGRQMLIALEMEAGTSVRDAIERSGILVQFPEIDPNRTRVGEFGRLAGPATPLRDGDRVEIYRPLIADPKEARRGRVRRAPRKGGGG